jgi:hypothetical protein
MWNLRLTWYAIILAAVITIAPPRPVGAARSLPSPVPAKMQSGAAHKAYSVGSSDGTQNYISKRQLDHF